MAFRSPSSSRRARVGSLRPEDVAEMLDDRFALLSEGNRGAFPRHRTLRAALEWSYELLTPPERSLFDCLGVFAGGWSLDAARAISAGHVSENSIPMLLGRLDQCSLVTRRVGDGATRYEMLETVRELSKAHLDEQGESEALLTAHLQWYLNLAGQADLEGPEQRKWLEALVVDHDNLRRGSGIRLRVRRSSRSGAQHRMPACSLLEDPRRSDRGIRVVGARALSGRRILR